MRRTSPRSCKPRPARCWRRNNAPLRLPLPRQTGEGWGGGTSQHSQRPRHHPRLRTQQSEHIVRMVDIQPDPRQLHDRRLDPKRARRRQMRQEAVVAKVQRHHQRRRAQHRIGPTFVMRGNDGERWRGATRRDHRVDLRCRDARDVAGHGQHRRGPSPQECAPSRQPRRCGRRARRRSRPAPHSGRQVRSRPDRAC